MLCPFSFLTLFCILVLSQFADSLCFNRFQNSRNHVRVYFHNFHKGANSIVSIRNFEIHSNPVDNSHNKKNFLLRFLAKARSFIVASIILASSTLLAPRSSQARSATRSGSAFETRNDRKTSQKSNQGQHKVVVEVEIDEEKIAEKNDFLTKVGYGMAGVSLLKAILSDDSKKKQSVAKKGPSKKTFSPLDDDSTEDDEPTKRFKVSPEARKVFQIPNADDIFEDSTLTASASSRKIVPPSNVVKPEIRSPTTRITVDVTKEKTPSVVTNIDEEDDLFGDIDTPVVAAPVPKLESKLRPKRVPVPPNTDEWDDIAVEPSIQSTLKAQLPPPPAPAPPPPAPIKKDLGLLGRFFQKPGGDRPTNLPEVMDVVDSARDFRRLVGAVLTSYIPIHIFPEFDTNGKYEPLFTPPKDEDSQAAAVAAAKDDCQLTDQQAADAFAEVANVLLIKVVDNAAEILEKKGDDSDITAALDVVSDFVRGAGAVFIKNFAGCKIDPVLYNGKTKKGRLEDLYLKYYKSAISMQNMDSIMAGFGGADGGAEDGEQTEEAAAEAEAAAAKAAAEVDDKLDRTLKVLQVFAIKEGKRNSIEQKALKEMFMSNDAGGGAFGALGAMKDIMTGKSSKDVEAMMNSFGDLGAGIPPGMDMDGLPDVSKMNPDELAGFSKELLLQVSGWVSSALSVAAVLLVVVEIEDIDEIGECVCLYVCMYGGRGRKGKD